MKPGNVVPRNIVFYEDKNIKPWHKYADILVPLVTVPTLILIGFYLHNYVVNPKQMKESNKWKVFALCGAMLGVSFTVFCYLCIRLNPSVLGRRKCKTKLSFMRNSSSNNFFMRSVNSDLQFMVPFNSYPPTYESIILDVPPSYTVASKKCKPSSQISNASSLKIVEV